MYSSQFRTFVCILFFLIGIVHNSRATAEEHHTNTKESADDKSLAAARLQILKSILSRRSLYDPAFDDSWSNYLEERRSVFDPAYSDWANSFKRSNE